MFFSEQVPKLQESGVPLIFYSAQNEFLLFLPYETGPKSHSASYKTK
jgi:hypothetical protein